MPSISSATLIKNRTIEFYKKVKNWALKEINSPILARIDKFFQDEYNIIPKKERIGKGAAYISSYISKSMVLFIIDKLNHDFDDCLALSKNLFNYGEERGYLKIQHLLL